MKNLRIFLSDCVHALSAEADLLAVVVLIVILTSQLDIAPLRMQSAGFDALPQANHAVWAPLVTRD